MNNIAKSNGFTTQPYDDPTVYKIGITGAHELSHRLADLSDLSSSSGDYNLVYKYNLGWNTGLTKDQLAQLYLSHAPQ